MCGIAGFYLKNGLVDSIVLEDMAGAIAHRGPDDQGYFTVSGDGKPTRWNLAGDQKVSARLGLAFRRLSILDLTPMAAQPMSTPDGRFTMVFNGQIYNYLELRKELQGISLGSTGDTEVLLRLLAKMGPTALDKLDGMFAFALYDRETRELMLARDPMGIKPLYYFQDERGFFFASEIRALWRARREKPAVRLTHLSRYFMNNWIPDPDTLFEGIQKLEPGHFLTITDQGRVTNRKYWDLDFKPEEELTLEDWAGQLDAALQGAVDRQLRSDVPVGFFLSGGVDSSLLTAKASTLKQNRPTTFTIGFKWAKNQADNLDLRSARKVRDRYDLDYREITLEPSIVSMLPQVVDVLEEPIADAAAICSYLICEAAKKEFKVLISGQGGDELFGGYPVYQAGRMAATLATLPPVVREGLALASQHLPYSVAGRALQTVHRVKKIISAQRSAWPDAFLLLRSPMRLEEMEALFPKDVLAVQAGPFDRHRELIAEGSGWDSFHQMMALDTKTYLSSLNLAYSDKTSMHHSVELRVPLLDREIVNLVMRMPSRMKLDMSNAKIVLKKVAEKYLPHDVIYRKKAGFGLPLRDWFLEDLQPMAHELLSENRLRRQGILNPALPLKWLKEHREKKADHCMKLYALITFQLWCDRYGI